MRLSSAGTDGNASEHTDLCGPWPFYFWQCQTIAALPSRRVSLNTALT